MPVGAGFIPARIGENKKMTEHKKLQPEIRFAGFTDDWEQRKLGEVVNVLDNLRIPIAASQRLEGVTPYYGANGIQGYIDGFTHDGEFVLVAEDGANDLINYPVQYVSGKVWINNHAHVLQGIKNVANNLFLVYRIKSMDMTKYLVGGGRTKLNASVMKDIELHLPNYAEQTQIGNFFKQLDDTIALHQGTLEKYQKLKVSYLEKMFPKENELYPELRFPNFTDAWEQRKLGEVVNVLDNLRIPIAASQRLEGVTPYYGANGIQGYIDGFTHDGEFVLVAEDGANDLINYPVQYVSGKVWINNHAHVLQGIKNVANNLFLVYRIKSMDMTKYLVGGGRTKLNASVMKDIELHLPNYAEQTQIGNFFKQLDDTIALHQKELAKYQQIKTACLEKMFVE